MWEMRVTKRLSIQGVHVTVVAVALFCALGAVRAQPAVPAPAPARAPVQEGIATALACETEIDDDYWDYGNCIDLALDALKTKYPATTADATRRQAQALAGAHWQAWLMADLGARQGAVGAAVLRKKHEQSLRLQLKAARWALERMCELRKLRCKEIRQRMAQKVAP